MNGIKQIIIMISIFSILSCSPHKLFLSKEAELYIEKARAFPLKFKISEEEEEAVWGRAQSFITKYSTMKIQTVTKFVIETYNPIEKNDLGYKVVKTPVKDGFVIEVFALFYPGLFNMGSIEDNLHILAYYMKTGEYPPEGAVYVPR